MRLEDIEAVEELFQEYVKINTSRREAILESRSDEYSDISAAEVGGKVVGIVHQVFYADPLHRGPPWNILFLYVSKSFRSQGIGELVLKETLNNVAERQVPEVHVSTRAGNVAAIELYMKLGFRHSGPLFEYSPRELIHT